MDCIEHRLFLEITTPQQARQAQRKLDALVIAGWEVLSMNVVEKVDEATHQLRRFREIVVCGDEIQSGR